MRPLYSRTPESRLAGLRRDVEALKRRKGPSPRFVIKVFADTTVTSVANGLFIFAIPEDVGGGALQSAEAFLTTAASGSTVVQIRNVTTGFDMLSTAITIDVANFTSHTATARSVVNPLYEAVSKSDRVAVDVRTAGAGGKGLGVILGFI